MNQLCFKSGGLDSRGSDVDEQESRARYDRSKLRYPSDVTDEEWELIVSLIPPSKSGGGKRTVIMREVANGLKFVLSKAVSGAQSRRVF